MSYKKSYLADRTLLNEWKRRNWKKCNVSCRPLFLPSPCPWIIIFFIEPAAIVGYQLMPINYWKIFAFCLLSPMLHLAGRIAQKCCEKIGDGWSKCSHHSRTSPIKYKKKMWQFHRTIFDNFFLFLFVVSFGVRFTFIILMDNKFAIKSVLHCWYFFFCIFLVPLADYKL